MQRLQRRGRSLLRSITNRTRHLLLVLLLGTALAACDNNPVVLVATAVPPDANYRTYRHPAFSLRLPPDWSVRDVSTGGTVRVEFSPPGNLGLPVSVHILNIGTVLSAADLLNALSQYQTAFNGDPATYQETGRTAQGDGSWRISAIRQTPIGARQMNAFFSASGTFLAVIEADLTDLDSTRLRALQTVINTLRLDPNAAVAASDINMAAQHMTDAGDPVGSVTFSGLYSWTNPQGEFIINGQVTNESGGPLEAIRVTAILYDAANRVLDEQQNVIPSEVLTDRATVPFSIRFRQGKPARTVRYELQAAARSAEYALPTYLGDDKFIRGNEVARYNVNGFLVVSGDVVNRTQGAAYFVKAIVAVLDEGGRVVATDSAFISKPTLLPGEAARFELTFPELGGSAIRYVVSIEGKTTN